MIDRIGSVSMEYIQSLGLGAGHLNVCHLEKL
jgi:hypothetical protein